jgi:hypothetical protein
LEGVYNNKFYLFFPTQASGAGDDRLHEGTHLKIVEVEPRILPGGGDGQLEGQLVPANVNAHQIHDGDVNIHLGPQWLSLRSVVSFNTLYNFLNC